MINRSVLDRLILRSYAWRQKLRRPRPVDFTAAFRQTARVLICLPVEPSEAETAVSVVSRLAACLRAETVTIIAPESVSAACSRLSIPARVLTIGPDDRHWTGLLTTAFVARVRGEGLDAAIDLNPGLNMPIASLCVRTRARLRMCFHAPYRELFFNMQIAVSPDETASTETTTDAAEARPDGDMAVAATLKKSRKQAGQTVSQPSPSPYVRFLHALECLIGQPASR